MRYAAVLVFSFIFVCLVAISSDPVFALAGGPCSGSMYPECDGECSPGEVCITDETAQCICVADENTCGSSTAPECDGTCDNAEEFCQDVGGLCGCVREPDVACDSTSPSEECGGACPPDMICAIDESGATTVCACRDKIKECAASDPVCDGLCAEGDICITIVGAGCVCQPGAPCGDNPGVCDGFCPADGNRCVLVGADCLCQPVDVVCSDAAAPECDGRCPDDQLCVESAVGGSCTCQTVSCSSSPFPECGGDCPVGFTCRDDDVIGGCVCEDDNIPCDQTTPGECGGVCSAGSVCRQDASGTACECSPVDPVCGDALAPVCDGDCPIGESCEEIAAGESCECVPHLACGSASAPVCDGDCAQGEVCEEGILGDCECIPTLRDCGDSTTPVCDGACADDNRCEYDTANDICACRDCVVDGLVPGPGASLLWVSNERLRWSRVTCAESYNVYRKDDTFTDTDGNGAAEDYGACLASNLRDPEFDDAEVPPSPIGFFKYLVTGFNTTAGEGTLDSASSGALRPNVSPCP